MMAGIWIVLAAAAFSSLPWHVAAHEIRPLIASLKLEPEKLRLVISLNLEAAMAGIGPEHFDTDDSPAAPVYDRLRALSSAGLETALEQFAPQLSESIALAFDGRPAETVMVEATIPDPHDVSLPRISEVTFTGSYPADVDTLTWRVDLELGDSVLRVLDVGSDEVLHAAYVPAGETSAPLTLGAATAEAWPQVFGSYLRAGFVHIIPKGLDHILFVVGLFLLSTRLSVLAWQVSAFTLAHTATLGLAALGLIQVSPAIVEPLIALSIAWIGMENVFTDRLSRWRPLVVFAFGLLHGLGFAGVLEEIGFERGQFVTALVGFNIGVEVGQLAVIAACLVVVDWFMRAPYYRRAVTIPGSLVISCNGLFWAAERAALI